MRWTETVRFSSVAILAMVPLVPVFMIPSTHAYGPVVVEPSVEEQVVSFELVNGNDSSSIYGFIVTIADGQYSNVRETLEGWFWGVLDYTAVIWTTDDSPVQLGESADNFSLEIDRNTEYTIHWSALDHEMHPVAWGSFDISAG